MEELSVVSVGYKIARMILQRPLSAILLAISVVICGDVSKAGEWVPADFSRPLSLIAPAFKFNPTTPEKAAAGRQLFFDPRLSGSNTISCASCHIEAFGWTDRKRSSAGHDGELLSRRTQMLSGVGWVPHLGWDGGIDSLEGFSLAPIARAGEMNQDLDALVQELSEDPQYRALMKNAFGSPEVRISRLSQSLAAYMRTLVPPRTAFDNWVDGDADAISDAAKAGFELFVGKAGCANCHTGWRFTDDAMHDIGLVPTRDVGRERFEPENPKAKYAFKTPSLRGVKLRPPYMHDGSADSLDAVIQHYDDGVLDRRSVSDLLPDISLTGREKLNLVYFLRTL